MNSEGIGLDTVIYGAITVEDVLLYGLAAMVAVWILRRVINLFRGKPKMTYSRPGKCPRCKWSGNVSKYKSTCPKCGSRVQLVS